MRSGEPVVTKWSLPYTNEACHFITWHDMTAKKAIEYLLSYAVGENGLNPPAYLIHNLLDNRCYLTTMEMIYRPSSIAMQPAPTQQPFSVNTPLIPGRQFAMKNVASLNDNEDHWFPTGIDSAKLMHNYKFYEYSQEDRQWENFNVSKLVLDDLVTKGIDDSRETSLHLHQFREDIELSKYYQSFPHNHPKLYDVMRNLELFSSNIMFTVDGDLRMDIGNVIYVNEEGTDGRSIQQFNGSWVVIKVVHSFANAKYLCHIVCARRYFQFK
jgi:hypothetical protein